MGLATPDGEASESLTPPDSGRSSEPWPRNLTDTAVADDVLAAAASEGYAECACTLGRINRST